jgi:two-component system alkaline phosphatase synthesis response regulator PhoP
VTKPFVFRELLLRLNNTLKRARDLQRPSAATEGVVRIGLADVDFRRFTARVGDTTHPLTHKECAVLKLLAERPGVAITRDEILDRAWSPEEFPTQRTVDNFIVRLRRLVEKDPANPRTIRSIRGVGYLFEA